MRIQRSSSHVWIIAVLLVAGLTILSPAYLHFTRSGPEFASMPEAPDNPHSDALCDKIYANYQTQIATLQAEETSMSARAAKDPDHAPSKAEFARIDSQMNDLTSQGIQVRDDCYVKVANWQTDLKTAEAKKLAAGAHAAPQPIAARPEAAPAAATPAEPMQVASATPAAPPARAYAVYAPPAQAGRLASAEAAPITPVRHHRARRARSSEYAWSRRRSHGAGEDSAGFEQAYYAMSGPRVAVGSYDKILVANADGVVRIPADGVSGVVRVASARPAHRAIALASSVSLHRRAPHILKAGYRPHAGPAHRALTIARAANAPVSAYAPTTAPAAFVAASALAAPAPSTSTAAAIPAPRPDSQAPPVAGRVTSGLDPPTSDGILIRTGTTCVDAAQGGAPPCPAAPNR